MVASEVSTSREAGGIRGTEGATVCGSARAGPHRAAGKITRPLALERDCAIPRLRRKPVGSTDGPHCSACRRASASGSAAAEAASQAQAQQAEDDFLGAMLDMITAQRALGAQLRVFETAGEVTGEVTGEAIDIGRHAG